MSQKTMERKPKKQNEPWARAFVLLLCGCAAELYLLLIHRFYIYGNLTQVLAWDSALRVALPLVGVVIVALGLVLMKKLGGGGAKKQEIGKAILVFGIFFAVASLLSAHYYSTAVSFLSLLVPAVTVLGILWCMYEKECSVALTVLGADILVLWLCRRGIGNSKWNTLVLIGAVLFLLVLAAVAFFARKLDAEKGMWKGRRLVPANFDPLAIYVACGASAAATVAAFFSSAAAYYAIWILAVAIFALAVYYTIRQL